MGCVIYKLMCVCVCVCVVVGVEVGVGAMGGWAYGSLPIPGIGCFVPDVKNMNHA